ncbi:MAG: hypothetical protein COZ06_16325 [Armatimonadetes bacterium CG_4_10_14_3_um_filter_66_18]|nr:hypothetical protein [Armatimonadota bacterium]OIP01961.1 MAG: hypothetical protein AUJ96_16675 [Armatimonadetes bacterium CG2_30_66_41]PIU94473.1 MAG: hypothetical protein COS65_07415 [Armatimonadetes bacterium CG06_land_8_20_14_3_00_66_21]PIX45639.1 MAG: hypothetical protein COZ57_14795 [Armatimonadetes bacterium CG_4_8_14_3_um_filter_66_20]PIY48514.1 MAG: hypothetical protein COZ06_16325 [Armatimonadetes bacterium CG_4_10_14_3_um_filter_66_18]PIZ49651.1 MAG: hypothetical protein COY42_03
MPTNRKSNREDRRQFFRQSAQVAAASLFAGAALEEVIEAVIHRVGESKTVTRVAGRVAEDLRGLHLQPQALADQYCEQ